MIWWAARWNRAGRRPRCSNSGWTRPVNTTRARSRPSAGSSTAADRKSTRLNSSYLVISYAVFCLKTKRRNKRTIVGDTITSEYGGLADQPWARHPHSRRSVDPDRDAWRLCSLLYFLFFFNDTATTEIYTLSLHDALPICRSIVTICSGLYLLIGMASFS